MEEELHDISNDCESINKGESADPLDCAENTKSDSDSDQQSRTNSPTSSMFTNDIVMTVINRLKNPFGQPEFAVDTIAYQKEYSDGSQNEATERKRRYKNETKEQQEIRLLRQRMIQMKNRLFSCLMLPEKAEEEKKRSTEAMRLKRKKAREMETPEEAAARKKRHAEQMRMSRKRLLALETPEQTAARIAKRNQRKKLRDQERHARETPEERAARREREKSYREKLNEKYKMPNYLAAKTGKIRKPKVRKIENRTESSELAVKSQGENNSSAVQGIDVLRTCL